MSIALVTLCGQAYGAGQIEHTGIYVQRSWIVLTATCIIILPLHIYATPILEFLGQDKDIADLAGTYSIKVIPNMFSLAIRHPIMRFLEAQSKVKVITFISFLALLLENVLFYIFIYVFGWGTTGLAMANNLTGWVVAVALVVHTVGWCKEGWRGLSWLAFKDLWAFTRLSLASSVMNCLQNLNVTCIILLAGQLDNPVIVVGSYSICVRVSNTLGMSHPKATKYSFFVAMFQSLLLGILFLTVIFLCKDDIAIIFSNSKDMIKAVSDLAYLLGLTMVLVSASLVISGVAIGCGWQVMVAYINLASYYIVGIPLGVYLGFKQHFGVKGLWGGTMCGNVLQIIVLMLIIWQTNWIKEVEQTADRMRSWSSKNLSKDMLEDGT